MRVRPCEPRSLLQPSTVEGCAYQLDPYIGCEHRCRYCYALNEAECDSAEEILIHSDLPGQLGEELARLAPQTFYLGWACDPYQPVEEEQRQTRAALEVLAKRHCAACILTKSDRVSRDEDLLRTMPGSSVGISLAFHDETVRQLFEPAAPPNAERIEALKRAKAAGIPTYALVTPVLPHLTQLQTLIASVAGCADRIWFYGLRFAREEDPNWEQTRAVLGEHYPELVDAYREIAFDSEHPYWTGVREELQGLQTKTWLDLRIRL